ncbi:MAG: hypothetical protein Q8916_01510 [Bacteroidota bacterium]|nr:hypothetical protein [Bacteroidota bacterium]MDP4229063.1 hypothetical protein [Bacteroidota bacterium]MDP4235415.1 hypothetical protein [Bacteroidota bacterium]
MNIRDEEQLQQYFERQMTSSQEQNFLINVAARDDMRLAFRSQLELLKAVREDKDASGSPTFVRSKTLGALGLSGALVPSSLKEQESLAAVASPSFWQNVGAAFRRPMVSITTGILMGILGTAVLAPSNVNPTHEGGPSSPAIISTPSAPEKTVALPAPSEPAKDLEKRSTALHHPITRKPVSQTEKVPVVNNTKPGTINVDNTLQKPGESEKK